MKKRSGCGSCAKKRQEALKKQMLINMENLKKTGRLTLGDTLTNGSNQRRGRVRVNTLNRQS